MAARVLSGVVALSVLLSGCASAPMRPAPKIGQTPQKLDKTITKTVSINYLLYLPKDYLKDKTQKWPVILFLHGAGERGSNLELLKKHGPPKLVNGGKEFPFIIVSPQCPGEEWWTSMKQIEALNALVDDVAAKYRVDSDRIYLTGLSMGGFGTWTLASEDPKRFAALAPICGGGQPVMARRIKGVPVWVFHGAKDNTVPVKQSEDMVAALKKAGADVKFTVYPEAGHDSWTETYDNPELYSWFLSHKRTAGMK